MAINKVREYLKEYGFESKIQEFHESSATVELAALALGIEGAKIAKSMGMIVDEKPIVVVVAGDMKIDNHKYKETFKCKAKMVAYEDTEKVLGHAAGGVCPFALNEGINVYLDESLKRFEYVYPACGSSNSAIKLTTPELELLSHQTGWVDVCKSKIENL